MFWADKIADDACRHLATTIARGKPVIIRDEKTLSGRMLISAMRGAAIHGILSEIFSERKIHHEFLWEINDTDAFRSIPKDLDEEKYRPYLGKPLYTLPSPQEGSKNYPEFFAEEFIKVMKYLGFHPTYYRSSDAYKDGKFNDAIKIALEKAELIRKIYKEISGSEKPADWLPLMVVCEKCGKIGTTKVISFDGESVAYICSSDTVEWADGCGHSGTISPFDGRATLPWKVEWAAKFKIFHVSVEGGGKDLSTRGGARDVANHIAKEIFEYDPPFDIPYEFFLADGKKMSTSKGNAPAAYDVMSVLPSHVYRLVFFGKNYKQAIEFNLSGETVPILFDTYDRLAEKYWSEANDDNARLFALINSAGPDRLLARRFLPRFSQIAFLVQMPHMSIEEEVCRMKGGELTEADRKELEERAQYAMQWLDLHAPEKFKYTLQIDAVPSGAKNFSDEQKELLKQVLEYIRSQKKLEGQELHSKLHEIKKEADIDPKAFFSALYLAFLGKEDGPKAGWFLSVLDKDFLEQRLEEVIR